MKIRFILLAAIIFFFAPHVFASEIQNTSSVSISSLSNSVNVINFRDGAQVKKLDISGQPIDAHDGGILQVGNTFYFYGTSYKCGFTWKDSTKPWCGFKVYSSPDLVNWTDRGFLFDPNSGDWQSRCTTVIDAYGDNRNGCFRPHVVYNSNTNKYILSFNDVSLLAGGTRIFLSNSPTGPFVEQPAPTITAGYCGDTNIFTDDDGTGYLVCTDIPNYFRITIEKLNPEYTSGLGSAFTTVLSEQWVESPILFKKNGIYYLTSGSLCPYCTGTDTRYATSSGPLGPWNNYQLISSDSCGGQSTDISQIKIGKQTIYLFQSDLWKGTPNEYAANYFWAPLSFTGTKINPINCVSSFKLSFPSVEQALPAEEFFNNTF